MSILALITTFLLILAAAGQQKGCQIGTVCYAIDQSGSVSSSEYESFQNFTVTSARTIGNIATSNPKYSAIAFSDSAADIVNVTADLEGVLIPEIEKSDQTRQNGGTNIYDGMRACAAKLGEDTDGKARVMLLLTDGSHNVNGANATNPIEDYKRDGMAIVTVGVGFGSADANLRAWASAPKFFIKTDFNNITTLASQITKTTCKAANSVLSPTPSPMPHKSAPPQAPKTMTPRPTISPAPAAPVFTPVVTAPVFTPPSTPVTPTLPGSVRNDCQAAYDQCMFTFDYSQRVPEYYIPATPDYAFTGRIEFKNSTKRVGILNSGKFVPEFISSGGIAQPITAFGSQPFAPTAFKAFAKKNSTGSGIGHEVLQGNQLVTAGNQCVRVFFNAYQLFYSNGYVLDNVNLNKKNMRACVVFLTKA